jgi:hypothetical protein
MKKNRIWGAGIFMLTFVVAALCYLIVFRHYDQVWFNFRPIFFLCMITFCAAVAVFVGATVIEHNGDQEDARRA